MIFCDCDSNTNEAGSSSILPTSTPVTQFLICDPRHHCPGNSCQGPGHKANNHCQGEPITPRQISIIHSKLPKGSTGWPRQDTRNEATKKAGYDRLHSRGILCPNSTGKRHIQFRAGGGKGPKPCSRPNDIRVAERDCPNTQASDGDTSAAELFKNDLIPAVFLHIGRRKCTIASAVRAPDTNPPSNN